MNNNFKKVHTVKDLTITIMVLITGIGIFFTNELAGGCIVFCALAMLIFYKNGYKKDGHGILLKRKSKNLCKCFRSSIIDFLNGKDIIPEIKEGFEGGSVRLDVYYNRKAGIAYAQLFDFQNYSCEPETDLIELQFPRADELISRL